ncbi:hypothetical protein WICPIJ_007715 [Wickerhamomyces pijperi]|uniref:2-dehydropantoate 2-reductase n=1 Tax=Wickerhamomyces pijperi TaxID=599730 RepID=A0A9P8PZE1_WICPI|nr:hypothetical protein WICPIJ_007715 [Wickerhamomyces pijperi]
MLTRSSLQKATSISSNNMIHILGAGAMGCLVAQELSSFPTPPAVTLLFRNEEKSHTFRTVQDSTIQIKRLFPSEQPITKYQYLASSPKEQTTPIETLFVSTKTYQTKPALEPYLPLITPQTNILLIQNGLGVVEELYRDVWPDISQRPQLWQGVINHGAYLEPVAAGEVGLGVTHAGLGDLFIARVPRDLAHPEKDNEDQAVWADQLVSAEGLVCKKLQYSDLLVKQVKKFIVNICVNSSTAILDCLNGEVAVEGTESLYRSIITEAINVLFTTKPILSTNELSQTELDIEKLVSFVIEVATVWHGKNSSSMRQDTVNLRDTEVDYLTGFIVTQAQEIGSTAPVCSVVSDLVRMRLGVNRIRASA